MSAPNTGGEISNEEYYKAKALLTKLQLQEELLRKSIVYI